MKTVILAAGKPAIGNSPVSNIEVCGARLIDVQVGCLRKAGIEDIVLVVGYRGDDVRRPDIRIRRVHKWEGIGSLGTLRAVADEFDEKQDTLVLYGDTIVSPSVIDEMAGAEGSVTALCYIDRTGESVDGFREYTIVEAGRVKKVARGPESQGLSTVFAGGVLVRRTKSWVVRKYLEREGLDVSAHVGGLINVMCQEGVDVMPIIIEKGWAEITSQELYERFVRDRDIIAETIEVATDWGIRSQRYDRLAWVNNDKLLEAIVEMAVANGGSRLLDVGTGTGKVLFALRERVRGGEYWGIDFSRAMLEKMPHAEDVTVRCVDIEQEDVPLPKRYFDVATARMVFHHLTRPIAALKNIRDVLRPGGVVIVCEGVPPSSRSVQWYTDMFRYKEDRRTLTEGDLIYLLVKAGYEEIITKTVVLTNCSLNNWLENSGLPDENIEIIRRMHFEAPPHVKEDYDMKFQEGDCLMTWRFAVCCGRVAR